ncbi:MAG: hypothetical protein R3F17_11060 [Planctomycetota bacterium]
MVGVSTKIKRLLLNEGLVSSEEWQDAVNKGGDVIESLLKGGVLEEEALMEVFGRSAGIPPVNLTAISPDPQALELIEKETCKEHRSCRSARTATSSPSRWRTRSTSSCSTTSSA